MFERECAVCHRQTSATSTAPSADVLRQLSPDAIVTALTSGRMRVQGERLSEAERRAVAEFLTGRVGGGAVINDREPLCELSSDARRDWWTGVERMGSGAR